MRRTTSEGRPKARRLRSLRPRGVRARQRWRRFLARLQFRRGRSGGIFDQVFGDIMGGRAVAGAPGPARHPSAVEIDLAQAFAGSKVDIRVPTRVTCEACAGTGSEDKTKPAETCTMCKGAGKVRRQQGFFLIETRARPATAPARRSARLAASAAVPAPCSVSARCRSRSRPVSRTAPASA